MDYGMQVVQCNGFKLPSHLPNMDLHGSPVSVCSEHWRSYQSLNRRLFRCSIPFHISSSSTLSSRASTPLILMTNLIIRLWLDAPLMGRVARLRFNALFTPGCKCGWTILMPSAMTIVERSHHLSTMRFRSIGSHRRCLWCFEMKVLISSWIARTKVGTVSWRNGSIRSSLTFAMGLKFPLIFGTSWWIFAFRFNSDRNKEGPIIPVV